MEWMNEKRLPIAWLAIDRQDNDIQRFFCYFIGALQTLVPGLGEKTLEFFQDTRGSNLEVGLTLLVNELFAFSSEIALILDDFQVLDNPLILQGVSFLLKYLPSNLHLLIASRSEPELDLAWLRAKGRVVELGADELRFSGDEIQKFFRQSTGLQLPSETVQALEERTGGWITALRLAAISVENQADSATFLANPQGQTYFLAGFLAEEVLERQPEEVRQFLLRTSILDTLSGPLCDSVARPDSQPGYGANMLNRMEHDNLFITALNEKHEWFRYHPLFADYLRQVQAKASPDEIPELHKRAALWYEQNGNLADAFQQALTSQDMVWLADIIERNLQQMMKTGEISAINHWVEKLPEEILHQRPILSLAYAWSLIAARQLQLARYWLDDVRMWLGQFDKQTGAAKNSSRPVLGEGFENDTILSIRAGLAICHSNLAMLSGDMDQAAEFYQEAASILPKENVYDLSFIALDDSLSAILSGETQKAIDSLRATMKIARKANNPLVMVISAGALADMQAQHGQLSKAWETLQRAQYLVQGPDGNPLPLAGLLDISLGDILLEQDFLEEAEKYLEHGYEVTRSMWYLGSLNGVISLARLRQARGDISGVHATLEEAARMAASAESGEWDEATVAAIAVRLALQRNDLVAAELWWKKGGLPELSETIAEEDYPYHVYEYLLLTQACFLLTKGQATQNQSSIQRASELLRAILPTAEQYQRVTSQMEIFILLAMAQFSLADNGAKKTLLRALELGEPEGYRRIFLDEGWRLSELLRQCRREQQESDGYFPSLAFIDSLLEDIQRLGSGKQLDMQHTERGAGLTARLEDGFPISLSAREMEVLKLIADGKSNQEISTQLYLAINTTKRHAYNIFAKLEVSKRTQAVMKARQLGLIS
jgi:LuxR family maltose regulon positive regulatory protein